MSHLAAVPRRGGMSTVVTPVTGHPGTRSPLVHGVLAPPVRRARGFTTVHLELRPR
jgi:hypothetical protein